MRLSAPARYKVEQSEIAPTEPCRPKALRSRRPHTAIALCHQNLAPRHVTPARISTEIAVSKCSVIAASAFVLSCIRFGIAAATEAGVIALVWAFVLGKFVFREYSWRHLGRSLAECCVDSALIGFLIAASVPFAWILIADGMPQQLVGLTQDYALGPAALILVVVLTLFVAGTFLDLTPASLIAAPLFLPLLTAAGFDPVQVGIIMIINLQLGGVTPPVGILVFITAQISRTPAAAVFRELTPFVAAIIVVLGLVCAIPALTLGLWSLIG
nr:MULTISPECIES: TRAP transporter large permease subunit [unclassified Salipiger]